MKFTLSWLKDHLETSSDITVISDTLTNIGLEVEQIEDKAEVFKNFTVAKVLTTKKHPDADRLKICNVESILGNFQVVCGASNAKAGMMGIFAPENTFIPGTKINLKKSEIRGIESCGMLLSERELGISEEHDGIIELTGDYKIGDNASVIYGFDDPIIEINLTPNRSDCLSVRGIARDLAAAGIGSLKDLKIKKIKGSFLSKIKWLRKFDKKDNYMCPGVSGRFFKNVKNIESPEWLKRRLKLIGLRPISALVDITNYITFDLGRPIHVYDADKISGNLTMRKAYENETCKTLDEKEYSLSSEMIVISDDKNLNGIGGIMGGLDSGCSMGTKNIIIEVALFDPITITKTGRKLNLQSDARYRFERGIDYTSIEWGVDVASQMIVDLCGGIPSEIITDKIEDKKLSVIKYNTDLTLKYGGIKIDINEQIKILKELGFKSSPVKNKYIEIIVPSFRPDIDGPSDIVEEIIRIYGFDKIKPISLEKITNHNQEFLSPSLKSFYKSKRIIANKGYFETVTYSFMEKKNSDYLTDNNSININNPISSDLNTMRPSTFPNLLSTINSNLSRHYINGKLFEVGPNFFGIDEDKQKMVATGIQYGANNISSWSDKIRLADVYDIKSDVFYILQQLNVPVDSLQHELLQNKIFHPGKSSQLKLGKNIIANFGEISPLILKMYEIKIPVCGFEIFIDNLDQFQIKKSTSKNAYDKNSFQLVERDFAFLFPKNIKGLDIINKVKRIDKKIIKKVIIFDIFEGGKLPDEKKSIAFKVVLQPQDKTFTDKEIENYSTKIIDLISKSFEGELRQ